MADRTRIVSLSAGGRPVTVLDLDNGDTFQRVRGSFTVNPAARRQQLTARSRRYAGGRVVSETHENGSVGWTALVRGASYDAVATNAEALLAAVESAAVDRFVEWRPDGMTHSSLFVIAGPGQWKPLYQWVEFSGAMSMRVEVSFPVLPLAWGLPMTIWDDFATDTISDYTFFEGAGTISVSGGQLVPSSTAIKWMYHTGRGYSYGDSQGTLKIVTGTAVTNLDHQILLKGIDGQNALAVRIHGSDVLMAAKWDGNVYTTLQSTAATVGVSATRWLRGRIQGNVLTAEWWTAEPTPMGTPAATISHTLAGADITKYGAAVTGKVGIRLVPHMTTERYDDFVVEPYTFRNQTLPATISLGGAIPGDAPALADITITPSGGAAPPIFAMTGWTQRPATGLAAAPFGIFEAESGGDLAGWVSAADGGSRGGNRLVDTTATDGEVYLATYTVDPNILTPDQFTQGDLDIEVWAVAVISATLISPKLTLSARSSRGLSFGAERFSLEYGTAGKILTKPSTGTVRRLVRLGTVPLAVDAARAQTWKIAVAGDVDAGSSGIWGLDYLIMHPARQRALSPTGEPNDAYYPDFVASTSETVKLIRSDLSGAILTNSTTGTSHPDHGLGGSFIELPPGNVDMLVKLSSLAPDDTTSDATTEQLAHSATVSVNIIPRWHLLRSA